MAKSQDEGGTPPYLPWVTFLNFLKQIKASGIPTRIDSTVLKGRSGSDQSGIKTALRFLGLIGPDDAVTQRFRTLVGSMDSEAWKDALGEVVTDGYLNLTQSVDLDNGTLGELQQAFSQKGSVAGSVRDKAVRFYLSACREAGYDVSPHFGSPPTGADSPRKTGTRQRRARGNGSAKGENGASGTGQPTPPGVKEIKFPIPGKPDLCVWLPVDLSEKQWGIVDTYIRSFISLSSSD